MEETKAPGKFRKSFGQGEDLPPREKNLCHKLFGVEVPDIWDDRGGKLPQIGGGARLGNGAKQKKKNLERRPVRGAGGGGLGVLHRQGQPQNRS